MAKTLAEILAERTQGGPDETAYRFCAEDSGHGDVVMSIADVERAVGALGSWLIEEVGTPVVLLAHRSPWQFSMTFLACVHAGVIPVPVPAAAGGPAERAARWIAAISGDSGASVILTDDAGLDARDALGRAAPELFALRWLSTQSLMTGTRDDGGPPSCAQEIAYVQYTSGSTRRPKGIAVTHADVARYCDSYGRLFRPHTLVNWLPLYHDMGLASVVLRPPILGHQVVSIPTVKFVARPLTWLELIAAHGADMSGGPNFAYGLVTARVTAEEVAGLDLSSWRIALVAAEMVRADTLRDFAALLEPAGFSPSALCPAYALAEAFSAGGLTVTGEPGKGLHTLRLDRSALAGEGRALRSSSGNTLTVTSCGRPLPGQEVRIVDLATGSVLPEDRRGEIWLGQRGKRSYWGGIGDDVFNQTLPGEDGLFLRTGDLGFLHDGEVYVTGRLKSTIKVFGETVHAEDIEHVAGSAHDALRPGGCAAVQTDDRVTVLCEVRERTDPAAYDKIIKGVRSRLYAVFGLVVDVVALVPARTMPKTSSGKLARHAAADLLRTPGGVLHIWHR